MSSPSSEDAGSFTGSCTGFRMDDGRDDGRLGRSAGTLGRLGTSGVPLSSLPEDTGRAMRRLLPTRGKGLTKHEKSLRI